MFYKYNSFTGRVTASEAQLAYQPEALTKLRATHPEQVIQSIAPSSSAMSATKHILRLQTLFQKSGAPVHLTAGAKDLMVYRGAMGLSLVGLSFTFYTIFQMATGRMKKKER